MKKSNWRPMGKFAAASAVAALGFSALPAQAQEVYVQGGTQGGGIGGALSINNWLGVHADLNAFNLSHKFTAGGNDFDGEMHVRHLGVFADVFPFPSTGFRVTAGTLINRDRLNATAQPVNGFYSVNGTKVPAAVLGGQQAQVNARFPTFMPYVGIGWGHQPIHKGLGFVADLGVAYGRPIVGFNEPAALSTIPGVRQQLAAEESQVRDKIQQYRWYPILQIGISYRF